jgi:hypothetical protein
VNAYITLHYGLEYLLWAIQSIYPFVERIEVVYAAMPSHGHRTGLQCPDTADALWHEVRLADPAGKVSWSEGLWGNEGNHRDAALELASEDADLVVVVDADEVWDPEGLKDGIDLAAKMPQARYRVPFVHLWRSFGWACTDAMMPIRICKPSGRGEISLSGLAPVYHFGYAQKLAIIRYKEAIHGHKSEWRERWFEEKFLAWQPGGDVNDVHPTCKGIWNPQRFSREGLPTIMRTHPYWPLELIE